MLIVIVALLFLLGALYFLFKNKKPTIDSIVPIKNNFFKDLKAVFSGEEDLSSLIPTIEETLLAGDVGVECTTALIESLLKNKDIHNLKEAILFLKKQMLEMIKCPTTFNWEGEKPKVIFLIGVNGVGKTTTLGKLSSLCQKRNLRAMLVAGDTFRAAATEQLEVWAKRTNADFMGASGESDAASLIFDSLSKAKAKKLDVVLVDTAGRLHTKSPLMDELKKCVRVAEKALGRKLDEILLVIDATTGQNGLNQARVFKEAVPLTGVVLTKYDGSAKGGIIFAIKKETGLPIRFIGVGEGQDDLKEFDAEAFIEKQFETPL